MRKCFIIPYFGNFPDTFPLWIKCCRNNMDFNWLILTDNTIDCSYPSNVTIVKTSLAEFKKKAESQLDCNISLEHPYKLCDLRPFYGVIFSNELKNFDYWGYCDLDLIFGKLQNFFSEDVLNTYDKISRLGHMCLLKNNEEINFAYKECDYTSILGNKHNRTFDEYRFKPNINSILEIKGKKILNTVPYADINWLHYAFFRSEYISGNRSHLVEKEPTIFFYKNGRTYQASIKSVEVNIKEIAYFHFQKRKINFSFEGNEDFIFIPNKIIPYQEITKELIKRFSKDSYLYFISNYYKRIVRAIKNRI